MVLFVLCKLILQTRMRSHPVGLDIWFRSDLSFTSILHVWKQRRLWQGCAGLPEPSLVACVISTIISWAGSFKLGQNKNIGAFPVPRPLLDFCRDPQHLIVKTEQNVQKNGKKIDAVFGNTCKILEYKTKYNIKLTYHTVNFFQVSTGNTHIYFFLPSVS